MRIYRVLFCFAVIVLAVDSSYAVQVYRNVDRSGSVSYSDQPIPGAKSTEMGVPTAAPAQQTGSEPGPTDFQTTPPPGPTTGAPLGATQTSCGTGEGVLWADDFSGGLENWGQVRSHWGRANISYRSESGVPGRVMRVFIPAGSIDPASMRRMSLPEGGTGFKAKPLTLGRDCMFFSFLVRFPQGFTFVRGGKLPGLFGGAGNGGGLMPNGTDGFSTRFMWRENGKGEIYAYLPTSKVWGTSLGRGTFTFRPGQWHRVQQQLVLNSPGQRNGVARIWLDGQLAFEVSDLRYRDIRTLRIDGIYFDVFFGGNDSSWAPPKDTYVEFANFALSASQTP